ncbi:MAG: type IV pilus modification protein PilV [Pseudomonadota bacterium]
MNKNAMRLCSPRNLSRGFTLVEALVALVCLSIGLLGVAALQVTGLQSNLSSSWRSQATYLAYDIIDRMRANRDSRATYVIGLGAAPAGATVKDLDIAAWKANLTATLPGGDGTIVVGPPDNTVVTITVQWADSRNPADPPLVFTTRSRI